MVKKRARTCFFEDTYELFCCFLEADFHSFLFSLLFFSSSKVFEKCDAIAARKRAEGDEKWDHSDADAPYQKLVVPPPRPPRPPALYDTPEADGLQVRVSVLIVYIGVCMHCACI